MGAGRFETWTPDQRTTALRGALEVLAATQSLVCDLAVACDRAQDWKPDGDAAMAPWLVEAGSMTVEEARKVLRVGKALQDLPAINAVFSEGRLSWDQIAPAVRFATADTDETLAEELPKWTAATIAALATEARVRTRSESKKTFEDRYLSFTDDPESGGGHLRGFLPADQYATIRNELERRADAAGANPDTGLWDPGHTRLADALFDLCDQSTGDRKDPQNATVVIHVQDDVLAAARPGNGLLNQMPVGLDTIYRLACDADLEYSVLSEFCQTIGIGRRSQNIPWFLRRQVLHRDNTCRRKGCGRKIRHVHHIVWWTRGGPTDLTNLCGLCWHCHHLVHEGGWTITGNANQELVFHHPNGIKKLRSPPFRPPEPTRRQLAGNTSGPPSNN